MQSNSEMQLNHLSIECNVRAPLSADWREKPNWESQPMGVWWGNWEPHYIYIYCTASYFHKWPRSAPLKFRNVLLSLQRLNLLQVTFSTVHIQYHKADSPWDPFFKHACNMTRNIGKMNECRGHNEKFLAIKRNFQHLSLVIYRAA